MRSHVFVSTVVPLVVGVLSSALVIAQDQPRAPSATGNYKIDPVHSSNVFSVKHMNVSNFYGRFNELSGRFTLDDADPAKCVFEATLQTASVDTNNADRDKHLRSADYFDAEEHPTITFKSTAVKAGKDGKLEVAGDLTMRGVTKPITAQVERTGAAPGMRGGFIAGWEARFTIKRSEFGVGAPMGLGDDVHLIISVEGVRE
jgi:polyisoprenoid-binding protein YceI